MDFQFVELTGTLRPAEARIPSTPNLVVLSNVLRGGSESGPRAHVSLKYVAAGVEVYRYGGKTYPVAAGQFLAVPPHCPGNVEISHSAGGGASGMCVSLGCSDSVSGGLDAPMLFPSGCSALGRMLAASHRRMMKHVGHRASAAKTLIDEAGRALEPLLEETFQHLAGLDASRPATRYEILRKLNLARAYLHSVDDRPVALSELATAAGISQFHLLRNFRSCFGLPPSAYHRRSRLEAAKAAVDREAMNCGEAAQRFGFADGASFSHAYRRTFGSSPTRHLLAPANPPATQPFNAAK